VSQKRQIPDYQLCHGFLKGLPRANLTGQVKDIPRYVDWGGDVYIEREFIQNPLSSWEWIKNEGKIHNIVGSATFSNYV